MADPEITEALRRIEAKVDALTEWSGWFTTDGTPLSKAQRAEQKRTLSRIEREMDAWRKERAF